MDATTRTAIEGYVTLIGKPVRVIEGSVTANVRTAMGDRYFQPGKVFQVRGPRKATRYGVEWPDGAAFWFDADQIEVAL